MDLQNEIHLQPMVILSVSTGKLAGLDCMTECSKVPAALVCD